MKLRKLDKKAKTSGAVIALLVIIVFGMGILGFGSYTNWKFQLAAPGTGGVAGAPVGTYTIESFAFDSLVSTTVRAINTAVFVQYYSSIGGVWQQLGAAAPAAVGSIVLSGKEGGYIYAIVTTGTTMYLDVPKTTQMNNILSYVGYENVQTSAAMPQFVFKINVNGIVPGNRLTADIILNFYCYTYAAFTFVTAPANVTGVGTALNTTYLGWAMMSPAVGDGIWVKQITLSTNDTNPSTQTLYKQNIPGIGFLSGGTFTVSPQASAIVYTWTAPTDSMTGAVDLGSGIPWTYGSGTINKFDLTTAIQTTLTATEHDTWLLTVYWLDPTGAGISASQGLQLAT